MKKLYIQPQTDLVRMANGEPVMDRFDGGLAGSGTMGQPEGYINMPTRRGNPVAVMYI